MVSLRFSHLRLRWVSRICASGACCEEPCSLPSTGKAPRPLGPPSLPARHLGCLHLPSLAFRQLQARIGRSGPTARAGRRYRAESAFIATSDTSKREKHHILSVKKLINATNSCTVPRGANVVVLRPSATRLLSKLLTYPLFLPVNGALMLKVHAPVHLFAPQRG
jgi:hypothetical protein